MCSHLKKNQMCDMALKVAVAATQRKKEIPVGNSWRGMLHKILHLLMRHPSYQQIAWGPRQKQKEEGGNNRPLQKFETQSAQAWDKCRLSQRICLNYLRLREPRTLAPGP